MDKKISNTRANQNEEEKEIEYMRNIAFLTKEYGMGYFEVIGLPYAVFLSYLKWARMFAIEQTEEGRKALYKERTIDKTEPDLARVRQMSGYTKGVD